MYPELEKYKQIKKQYEEQLQRLKIEQEDLEEEKEKILQRYKEFEKKNTVGQSKQDNLASVRSELHGLTEELDDLLEESSHLTIEQKERLNEWMQPLKKGFDREVLAAKQHLKIQKDEFRRYRIEMLLLVQQVYEIEEYIHEVHLSYTEACREYLTKQDRQTLQLQAIDVRQDVKLMLKELQEDLEYVNSHGKMPKWFQDEVKAKV
ncbi:hypothetical protein [Pseudalkalibacillus salsuginis]|uniref:hypothetical protein n=1 Tax=Pseudalkalibacillus salsuginis TaxID=2910972 RepID=UPI001F2BEE0A|nr:hypothetical protein [Pseudalkalibacillus salsuginis]MCF6411146.1 hypothetical protein [Pseudalkalibacillus salsuginis]